MIDVRPVVCLVLFASACGGTDAEPVSLAPGDVCAHCRMTIADPTLAAQSLAPGEEPRLFDDIGCMAAYLKDQRTRPEGQVLFVADHRTKQWVRAKRASFTRVERLSTPMNSHLIAHSDAASRDADGDASGGTPVAVEQIEGRDARGGGP